MARLREPGACVSAPAADLREPVLGLLGARCLALAQISRARESRGQRAPMQAQVQSHRQRSGAGQAALRGRDRPRSSAGQAEERCGTGSRAVWDRQPSAAGAGTLASALGVNFFVERFLRPG